MAEAQTQTKTGTQPAAVKGGVVAYLSVEGALKCADFYQKAFAAELAYVNPPDDSGRTMHVHLYINGSSVMLSDPYPEHGCGYVPAAGISLMQPVKDVDAAWQRAVDDPVRVLGHGGADLRAVPDPHDERAGGQGAEVHADHVPLAAHECLADICDR